MAGTKVSLSLDQELLAEARAAVGTRGLSRYVNRALRHQLQQDRLRRLLASLEAEHGPIDPATLEEVRIQGIKPPQKLESQPWSELLEAQQLEDIAWARRLRPPTSDE